MGSVHSLSEAHYPLPDEFESAFAESDTLVVEVNLNDLSDAQIGAVVDEFGRYRQGDLRQHLEPETFMAFEDYLVDTHQPVDTYLSMKPWLVSLQVSTQMLQSAGYDPELGVDRYFLLKAQGNKHVLQLESFEDQVRLLADESPLVQDRMLRSSLKGTKYLARELASLVSAWQTGDADGMYRLALGSISDDRYGAPQLERLLDDRNLKMAEKINGFLNGKGTYLVIVGALHMGGERGLINLLAKTYPIRQIKRNGPG